jgi:hypothetical protein
MKKEVCALSLCLITLDCMAWGFYAHQQINRYAVFLLPPEMMAFYKPQIDFLFEHAVDPDKRRYTVAGEAPRHFIDIDHYGVYPYDSLPRKWNDAVTKFSVDTLNTYGIVPWWLQIMFNRLVNAFKEKNASKIIRLSAEIGHYIADAHVPLHATQNHNGQLTGQQGIHGFWESRIPELLAEKNDNTPGWDFFIGKAEFISNPPSFIWARVLESAAAVDTVLNYERQLTRDFPADQKFAFEERNGVIARQFSVTFSRRYDELLGGMVERRMRQSIFAVASFWYTAWINAGQPDLRGLSIHSFSADELAEFEELNKAWKNGNLNQRDHE